MSGLGAEVIKIEPPSGDPSRQRGPFPGDISDPEKSGTFLHLNTGKLGVTLDITDGTGRDLFRRLVAEADVFVESHSPGELADLGLGYDDLAALNESLVYVSVTPFGQDGPYANYKATEMVCYALGGYMMLTGEPDREPLKAYGNQAEFQAGQQASVAAIVALFAREATGRGQHIDVSIMEAAMFMLGAAPQAYFHRGDVARRAGARLTGMPPRMNYPSTIRPCLDGYVHVHGNNRHPDLLSVLMEEARLFSPEIMQAPLGHADEIDELMDPWLRTRRRSDIVRQAQELRLPFTEVMTPAEIAQDAHHRERDFWEQIDHPAVGRITQPGAPVHLSATPWRTVRSPLLGEHNRAIYCDRLGLTSTDLAELSDRGVV
jgi:crotonobetainyl-CoA:carnitine CoA-transferase CaiB-like acyl-CoA transferase